MTQGSKVLAQVTGTALIGDWTWGAYLEYDSCDGTMLILHAHWQLPLTPNDLAILALWAEDGDAPQPQRRRGRLPANPKPQPHPFCLDVQGLRKLGLEDSRSDQAARGAEITLRLPSTRTGPLPSPGLWHEWELDEQIPPFLAPWQIPALVLGPASALHFLTSLPPSSDLPPTLRLGPDLRFWQAAALLALETLAQQKLTPMVAQAGNGYHARWLPVLDGPKDGPRLARLQQAMPPLCRAGAAWEQPPAPASLLDSFLHLTVDAAARRWGRSSLHLSQNQDPGQRWLAALFADDPRVQGSAAELDALYRSQRAWLRNLHVAGDLAFRIAFRLEAPLQQAQASERTWQLHYLLQASDDPSLLVPASTVWRSKGQVMKALGRKFQQPQEKLLAGLAYAGRLFPAITESLKQARPANVALDTNQAYAFLKETAPLLQGAGFAILAPPWWNKPGYRLGVRLQLRPSKGTASDAIPSGELSLRNLVRFRWQVALGDTPLSQEEFAALVALKTPLVQIRGQWVQLDAEQIEAAIRFWQEQEAEGEIGLLEALRLTLAGEEAAAGLPVDQVQREGWLDELLGRFQAHEAMRELEQPQSLQATLRPYQRYGFTWLAFLRRWGLGACLADDMGLGKTIQTIALLLAEKEDQGRLPGPTLLIAPTSVVTNWEREVSRFAPALTTLVHQGPGRLRGDEFHQAATQVDLVLSSYAVARRDAEVMREVSWHGIVLDEAQNIKNPETKLNRAIRQFPAGFRIALTGTPVENRLTELWSIMHFLNPGYLGPRQAFRRHFALPIEHYGDQEAAQQLRALVGPFILRRVKTDPTVIQDLPDKLEMKVYCQLTEEQATLYQAVVEDALQEVAASEGMQRRGLVLSMLMQLKQICNHPVQYLHQAGRAAGNGVNLLERSGKLQRLVEMLEELLSTGDRALIFTQYAEMGHLLQDFLPETLGVGALYLHGSVPASKRDALVQRFQAGADGPPLFILSLKAGGTGLNLTRANHVFHFDRWWNPAVEDQATDRAYRIGQQRTVQVHKFITAGTLEERIDDMIESKKALADAIVGKGEGWLSELSTEDLREVIRLRR